MSQGPRERLLQVKNLTIHYAAGKERLPALDGINFEVHRAEVVGMIGESGSGKTTLALALLRLLPACARISQGSICFAGRDILALKESELEKIRGAKVSMTFQEPEMTLNPVMRAIDQVAEVIAAHHGWRPSRCRDRARRILAELGFDPTGHLLSAYPHELSGGQRQRLVIAQALACRPMLLIADEPTASLDSTLQVQWVSLMKDLRNRLGIALLLITHNPGILAGFADRVLVLYRGRIVEEAGFEELVQHPLHPYTEALLRSTPPRPGEVHRGTKHLPTIPGSSVPGVVTSPGCPFEPRCRDRFAACSQRDPLDIWTEDSRRVRCLKYDE